MTDEDFPVEQAVDLARFIERHHRGTVDLIGKGGEPSFRITVDRLATGEAPPV